MPPAPPAPLELELELELAPLDELEVPEEEDELVEEDELDVVPPPGMQSMTLLAVSGGQQISELLLRMSLDTQTSPVSQSPSSFRISQRSPSP